MGGLWEARSVTSTDGLVAGRGMLFQACQGRFARHASLCELCHSGAGLAQRGLALKVLAGFGGGGGGNWGLGGSSRRQRQSVRVLDIQTYSTALAHTAMLQSMYIPTYSSSSTVYSRSRRWTSSHGPSGRDAGSNCTSSSCTECRSLQSYSMASAVHPRAEQLYTCSDCSSSQGQMYGAFITATPLGRSRGRIDQVMPNRASALNELPSVPQHGGPPPWWARRRSQWGFNPPTDSRRLVLDWTTVGGPIRQ